MGPADKLFLLSERGAPVEVVTTGTEAMQHAGKSLEAWPVELTQQDQPVLGTLFVDCIAGHVKNSRNAPWTPVCKRTFV